MPSQLHIQEHRRAQDAAKRVLDALPDMIDAEDTEKSIAQKAHVMLKELGYADTWYYQCPALVLLGSRSCLSVPGKEYEPSEEKVGVSNLITVDLSPTYENFWGDCARSFPFENGKVAQSPKTMEFKAGIYFLEQLQKKMMQIVQPDTSFGQLFDWANLKIRERGFVNLDYRNNVGHSLARTREDREFIHSNNNKKLGDTSFFSFEPFVRLKGGHWGFKLEDIFYFNSAGTLERL